MTPLQAIRAKCMECSGGSPKEVRLCPCTQCPLYPFRFGRRETTQNAHFSQKHAEKPALFRADSAG